MTIKIYLTSEQIIIILISTATNTNKIFDLYVINIFLNILYPLNPANANSLYLTLSGSGTKWSIMAESPTIEIANLEIGNCSYFVTSHSDQRDLTFDFIFRNNTTTTQVFKVYNVKMNSKWSECELVWQWTVIKNDQ